MREGAKPCSADTRNANKRLRKVAGGVDYTLDSASIQEKECIFVRELPRHNLAAQISKVVERLIPSTGTLFGQSAPLGT